MNSAVHSKAKRMKKISKHVHIKESLGEPYQQWKKN